MERQNWRDQNRGPEINYRYRLKVFVSVVSWNFTLLLFSEQEQISQKYLLSLEQLSEHPNEK